MISEPTLRGALDRIVANESTPPGYYVIARAADRMAAAAGMAMESRTRAVRMLSIAFGLACVLLTFVLALELVPLWAAALAGLLVSFASPLVLHGSELRAYSLLAFSCVAFALLLGRAAAQPALPRLALLAGAVALGALTHYFFLFTLLAGAIWLLASGQRRSVVGRVTAAMAVGLLPLAAWSPSWVRQIEHGVYATSRPFTHHRFLDFVPSIFTPQAVVLDMGVLLHAAVTLAVLVPSVLLLRRREGRLCALFVLTPFLLVTGIAWATEERVFNTRNLIGVAPFAAIAVAWGCVSLPWSRARSAAGVVVAATVIAGFAYGEVALGRTPYDRIADEMAAQGSRPDEPIVWFGNYDGIASFAWYLTRGRPANTWPRVVVSEPARGTCTGVGVVAGTAVGRLWLRRHRSEIVAQTSTPAFANDLQGPRRPDLIVARLRWSEGILLRPATATNWFLLRRAGTASPCLRRKAR
ncbi:MAG: hypothetical protein ACRDPZ_13760 [Gaiellaceae bacterium]